MRRTHAVTEDPWAGSRSTINVCVVFIIDMTEYPTINTSVIAH